MQLSLKPMDALQMNGETQHVYSYEVCGMPEGEGAWIRNLDYPRTLWSILRFKNGVPDNQPYGNYYSADDALSVLQKDYD
jgi:hypothetical protein